MGNTHWIFFFGACIVRSIRPKRIFCSYLYGNVRETYFLFSLTTQTKQGCALNDQVKRMRILNVTTTLLNEINFNFSKLWTLVAKYMTTKNAYFNKFIFNLNNHEIQIAIFDVKLSFYLIVSFRFTCHREKGVIHSVCGQQ